MDKIINITIHYGSFTKCTDTELSKINKERLNKIIRKELNFSKSKSYKLTRKSKRSKSYVPLNDSSDFRALNRSLEVKNHLKLKIEDINDEDADVDVVDQDQIKEKSSKKSSSSSSSSPSSSSYSSSGTVTINKSDYKQMLKKINEIHESIVDNTAATPAAPTKKVVDDAAIEEQEEENNIVHPTIYCDVCNPSDYNNVRIKGTRYKCNDCFNYDLCQDCYLRGEASRGHSTTHSMSKISIIPRGAFKQGATSSSSSSSSGSTGSSNETRESNEQDYPNNANNCIFVDINVNRAASEEYESKIVEFVSKYDDVSKLSNTIKNIDRYERLLSLTKGDSNLLSTIVQSYIDSQNDSKPVSENPKLSVEISKIDQTLVFHLQNKGCLLTPKNLSLILTFFAKESGSKTKFSLSMGPHSIYPNGHKRLYYNMNGINESNFDLKNHEFTIELIDEQNKLYASGLCSDGSGLVQLGESGLLSKDLTTKSASTATSSDASTSSSSHFVTPSSSVFITDEILKKQDPKTIVNHEDDDEEDDFADDKTISEEALSESIKATTLNDHVQEEEEEEEGDDDTDSIATKEDGRSSTMTLTPEFVEVDEHSDAALVSTDLSDEENDAEDDLAQDYEVLSTDDYSD